MIVFPMAGISRRFFTAGYTEPKYKLLLNGESLFKHALSGFSHYFNKESFLFICRDIYDTPAFVERELAKLGLTLYKIVVINEETEGQADTVRRGLGAENPDERIFIFNIDTFRPSFRIDEKLAEGTDGYLETFIGSGANWSNVLPDENGNVLKTAEKEQISEYCCTGLYYFKRAADFLDCFNRAVASGNRTKGEYYVAPLYNDLIQNGSRIGFTVIKPEEVIFCGTPDEYTALGGAHPVKA